MDGSPMLFDLPPGRSSRASSRSKPSRTARKQPIRDAIMAYLTEARSAKEIAGHIERKVSIATGHLRAMGQRGLVVRVGWGQYVRADRCDTPPDPTTITRTNSTMSLVQVHAPQAESLEHLQRLTGRSAIRLLHAVGNLRAKGYDIPDQAITGPIA